MLCWRLPGGASQGVGGQNRFLTDVSDLRHAETSRVEVTTVANDEVTLHMGAQVRQFLDLSPSTTYNLDGHLVTTLPAPGELLCRFATVNDVHFGEVEAGRIDGLESPTYRVEPGAEPYPEMMNRYAVEEIAAIDPAAVLIKGDLTSTGSPIEYARCLEVYARAFGPRLAWTNGNHENFQGPFYGVDPTLIDLPGVRILLIDTSDMGRAGGSVSQDTLDWIDDNAQSCDTPVLLFGHHHLCMPGQEGAEPSDFFGIDPASSTRLAELVSNRPEISGYFCGHTHRNNRQLHPVTGGFPWAEVASVKDFPGTWAEYRVFEGGILQIHRRISAPEALEWSNRCRGLYAGIIDYTEYALGQLTDRCFPIWSRR